jgi:hypothetical protein
MIATPISEASALALTTAALVIFSCAQEYNKAKIDKVMF